MGIFDGYLFCADCDGTMTDDQGVLQPEDAEAINYFQQEGGLFTFATGRFPKYIDKFLDMFHPNTYQVMGNGTTLYDVDHERAIFNVTMEPPREVLQYIWDHDLSRMVYVDHYNHSRTWCGDPEIMKSPWMQGREYFTEPEDLFSYDPEPWHKIDITFRTPEEGDRVEAILKKQFPKETFVRSWATGMEMLPRGAGKGPCVMELKKILGPKIHTVVCAGDYGNDVSMIQLADIGYCVANGSEEAKAAADRITCSNEEHAIRQIVRDLEAEERSLR